MRYATTAMPKVEKINQIMYKAQEQMGITVIGVIYYSKTITDHASGNEWMV